MAQRLENKLEINISSTPRPQASVHTTAKAITTTTTTAIHPDMNVSGRVHSILVFKKRVEGPFNAAFNPFDLSELFRGGVPYAYLLIPLVLEKLRVQMNAGRFFTSLLCLKPRKDKKGKVFMKVGTVSSEGREESSSIINLKRALSIFIVCELRNAGDPA